MKKVFTIFSLLFMLVSLNASADVDVYLESTNVQAGAEGKIELCLVTDNPIATVNVEFTLPEGVKVIGNPVSEGAAITFNPAINNLLLGKGDPYYSTGVVATINVAVDADAELGDHPMTITMAKIVEPNLTTYDLFDVESTLTIQKTAVIEPLTDGYSLEVLPFVAKEGNSTIDVLFKSAATAKSVTFDIELPQGMMFYDENFDPSKPVLNASACTKTPTTTLTVTDETFANKATVSVMGQNTGAAALRKYINKLDELTTLASIPVYVVPADNIEEWGEEYELKEGVYTAKLNNIVVTDYASNTTFTGNYIASVIAGQPSAQEAILYGNYNEATASAFTKALKNVAIADVTAATVEEGVKFEDVLVNEKGGNSYYTRTSANYGTTVLPLDLTTVNVDELYMIESMDAKSIVIVEAENVTANTPCIFKGTINVDGATPTLGVPSEQGLGQTTFKGTYEATSIESGFGYYISLDGKFYGDGASIRPFRGYFDGAIAGAKALQVLLEDETGIKDITDQFSTEEIYNLMGVKMNNANKGVNIINGKKVYIK